MNLKRAVLLGHGDLPQGKAERDDRRRQREARVRRHQQAAAEARRRQHDQLDEPLLLPADKPVGRQQQPGPLLSPDLPQVQDVESGAEEQEQTRHEEPHRRREIRLMLSLARRRRRRTT